jgi:hypothetical protein
MRNRHDARSDSLLALLERGFEEPEGVIAMQPPQLDPSISDQAPTECVLTAYDEQHLITYIRLLDAEIAGADWVEVSRIVLRIDPAIEPDRARRAWESHLARARWISQSGYQHLLRGGAPN